jgi:DNA-binding transcriptional ArsR family regulator
MPKTQRQFEDEIYEQIARISKAAAAPKRLELLDLLSQGPRTVEVLADLAAITVGNASQHLKILRAARLVEAQKQGLYVEYRRVAIARPAKGTASRRRSGARA